MCYDETDVEDVIFIGVLPMIFFSIMLIGGTSILFWLFT